MVTQAEIDQINAEIAHLEEELRDLRLQVAQLHPDEPDRLDVWMASEVTEAKLIHAYKRRAALLGAEKEMAGTFTRKPNAPVPLKHWAGADWTVRINK